MKKIQKEYILKTSLALLFSRLSSPSGLAEWFADNVLAEGKVFTFYWGKAFQQAELIQLINNETIRFRWLDSGTTGEFEFTIAEDELTGDIALIVSDSIEDEEEEDAIKLWNSQISKLRHAIGS